MFQVLEIFLEFSFLGTDDMHNLILHVPLITHLPLQLPLLLLHLHLHQPILLLKQ